MESTTWRKRAIALGFGAVLSALLPVSAALPVDYDVYRSERIVPPLVRPVSD